MSRVKLLISSYKLQIIFVSLGILLVGVGLFLKSRNGSSDSSIQVLDTGAPSDSGSSSQTEIVVEVAGAVEKPAVYHLPYGSRIEDALVASGGLSLSADRNWVDRNLNRAAKLVDGQKVYIPTLTSAGSGQDSSVAQLNNGLININTASLSQLESLSGIGQTYGQNIIDHRPYSDVGDLISKKVLKQSVYDKIKDQISVY